MNAAALRVEVEKSLESRIPSALSVQARVERERVLCGIPEVDRLANGGFPVGAIAELVGNECSGRTTVAASFIAQLSRAGMVCAWVDVADSFNPESAAANGLDLERLLWVRCRRGEARSGLQAQQVVQQSVCSSPPTDRDSSTRYHGGDSPHPRAEGRGMPQAIEQLLQAQPRSAALKPKRRDKSVGTPGASNRPLTERVEQVAWDRLPPRRGENAQTNQYRQTQQAVSPDGSTNVSSHTPGEKNRWNAMDNALRATDMLLQSGGFSAIVLDLGSTPAEQSWRIPLSSWFRFRAACDRSRTTLVVLTQHPCARSSAELVVTMQMHEPAADSSVMQSVNYRAEVERQRFVEAAGNVLSLRKPPQREHHTQWEGRAAWAKTK